MLHASPLGKDASYPREYAPQVLVAIPRGVGRGVIGVPVPLPFSGVDMWTGYEVSWLDRRGKPQVAVANFGVPAASPCLVESKSLKLYLNGLNHSRFADADAVRTTVQRDLSEAVGAPVAVMLSAVSQAQLHAQPLDGESIDGADVAIDTYTVDPTLLVVAPERVSECLRSDLLKSNCPVTGQPDWASVMVRYTGPRIDRAALLRYIVSYRDHAGFHEQCVEQIFMDVKRRCRAQRLTVYARYTRRGGLDINPFRSDFEASPQNRRTCRQ